MYVMCLGDGKMCVCDVSGKWQGVCVSAWSWWVLSGDFVPGVEDAVAPL